MSAGGVLSFLSNKPGCDKKEMVRLAEIALTNSVPKIEHIDNGQFRTVNREAELEKGAEEEATSF